MVSGCLVVEYFDGVIFCSIFGVFSCIFWFMVFCLFEWVILFLLELILLLVVLILVCEYGGGFGVILWF